MKVDHAPSSLVTALRLGTRFSLGSRGAWLRTSLTALGVGLGVALLLLAASVPDALAGRDQRSQSRNDLTFGPEPDAGDETLLIGDASTFIGGRGVHGRLVKADGARPPQPPGLTSLPEPGEAVVSPALNELLQSPRGSSIRARIPYEVVGIISNEGLLGPDELAFYAGDSRLLSGGGGLERRIDHFGDPIQREPLDPVLSLLLIVGTIVLILPVLVFIATSTRFGVERRDRRLASLRLVGVDANTCRAMAAVEALIAACLGCLVGGIVFVTGRQLLSVVSVQGISVFPADAHPDVALIAAVVVMVPLVAVAASLLGLRGVVVEPLGVVRHAVSKRRRLWWRLILPAVGITLLLTSLNSMRAGGPATDVGPLAVATVLLLSGVLTFLPWLIEALVHRSSSGIGGVPWQLAVRRLQGGGATTARVVSGVAVAAAGIIALQMLFAGLATTYNTATGADPTRAALLASSYGLDADGATDVIDAVAGLPSVVNVRSLITVPMTTTAGKDSDVIIGSCAALAEVAELRSCKDGDVFRADKSSGIGQLAGQEIILGGGTPWTVPDAARRVRPRTDPAGQARSAALLATPGAVTLAGATHLQVEHFVDVSGHGASVEEAQGELSAALLKLDPLPVVRVLQAIDEDNPYNGVRTGLIIGGLAVLMMIGSSLLVSGLDQMSERRRVHSVLNAVGTPRSVLARALLLGSAIPVALGCVLAVFVGTMLGALLLLVSSSPVVFDLVGILTTTGLAALVVLTVTAVMLPALGRSLRADGLWAE